MSENWLPVLGYEGRYEVSDLGRVRSLERRANHARSGSIRIPARILKNTEGNNGYLWVNLYTLGASKTFQVHRLVLEAFEGPAPKGTECLHWDDDKKNNRLTNLRWGTRSENERDAVRNGRNFWRNKTHCPRNHELKGANLREGTLKRGARECKACARERAAAARGLRAFDPAKADERYKDILNGVDNRFSRQVN